MLEGMSFARSIALLVMAWFMQFCIMPEHLFAATTRPVVSEESWNQVSGLVIFYSGDSLRSSFGGGMTYAHHFNRTYWLGLDIFALSTHRDSASGLRTRNNQGLYAGGTNFYYNLPARLGDDTPSPNDGPPTTWRADLYTSVGLGLLRIDHESEIYGQIGGGLVAYPPAFTHLALHFDLKNLFYMLHNAGGDDFNIDMVLNLGPSWIF